MERYRNLGGNSNVSAFDISSDSITVRFGDGPTYLYNYGSTGSVKIEHMKGLALNGVGLNSFINRHVGKQYARKLA